MFVNVYYRMPDGKIKFVMEREDMVPRRLKYLRWANLEIIKIEKKRET